MVMLLLFLGIVVFIVCSMALLAIKAVCQSQKEDPEILRKKANESLDYLERNMQVMARFDPFHDGQADNIKRLKGKNVPDNKGSLDRFEDDDDDFIRRKYQNNKRQKRAAAERKAYKVKGRPYPGSSDSSDSFDLKGMKYDKLSKPKTKQKWSPSSSTTSTLSSSTRGSERSSSSLNTSTSGIDSHFSSKIESGVNTQTVVVMMHNQEEEEEVTSTPEVYI